MTARDLNITIARHSKYIFPEQTTRIIHYFPDPFQVENDFQRLWENKIVIAAVPIA